MRRGDSLSILEQVKNMDLRHNVSLRVIDNISGRIVSEHIGHNNATNSMLTGMGHYLKGDGIWNQGVTMLSEYVPRYISLGTMGLISQDEDAEGCPAQLGVISYLGKTYAELSADELSTLHKEPSDKLVTAEDDEHLRFVDYMTQSPGYGADGYESSLNNNRQFFGLGPTFDNRSTAEVINCELISTNFPRTLITYSEIVPEREAESSKTIDVVFSAMISTGALSKFREPGKDYIFITEVGLWSSPDWNSSGANGMLAGYRIRPSNQLDWNMSRASGRSALKRSIIKVKTNQIVQVVWKIQLGSIDVLDNKRYWIELPKAK